VGVNGVEGVKGVLADAPRFPLAILPTPLVRAERLERRLGSPPIWVKRDDLAGFAGAGHKARQLEFLVGAALAGNHDVLVAGGGPASNFCPAVAGAAAVAGLDCELVIYGHRPQRRHPNLAIALACGAAVRYTGDPERTSVDATMPEVMAELRAAGRRPFSMPRGGATAVGTLGMVAAAAELADQVDALGVVPAAVVIATGSAGTCAGLVVGTALAGRPWRIVAASVSRPIEVAAGRIRDLAGACAAYLGVEPPPLDNVEVVDGRGPGFGIPWDDAEVAADFALSVEGLLLDPVYTAKALAVLLRRLHEGLPGPIVFWHTGGLLAAAHHLATGPDGR
jgi:D-cysteine desulfhydrase